MGADCATGSDFNAVIFIGEPAALHTPTRFFSKQIPQSTTTIHKPHTMNNTSPADDAGQLKDAVNDTVKDTVDTAKDTAANLKDKVDETLKPLCESATVAYESMCKETSRFVQHTSEKIRENPVPAVVAAALFGAMVCYLFVSGRHEPTLRERFDPLADAGDNAVSSLRSLCGNLKFW
jgi:ElaB/YqjD/DUF883 family membrane-anchored ribosome-binding protein